LERSFNGHGTACRPPWRRLPFAVLAALLATGCVSERDGPNAREQQAANNPGALLRIAKAAERNGDLSGAAEFYNRAFDLRPDVGDAVIGLARTRAGLGRADEAIPALRDAHLRAPADHRLTALLGQLEVQAHRPVQAPTNPAPHRWRETWEPAPGTVLDTKILDLVATVIKCCEEPCGPVPGHPVTETVVPLIMKTAF